MFNHQHKLLTIFSIFILLLIITPLIIVLISSFGEANAIEFPIHGFTFKWYLNVFNQNDIINGLGTSLLYTCLACLAALIVGLPAVYAMCRFHLNHKKWYQSIFMSSVFLPEIVMGFAFYGFIVATLHLANVFALFIGYFALSLPFVVRFITSGLTDLNIDMERAAWVCGSSRLNSFFKIVLPSLKPYLIGAFILGFMNSFNSLTISLFLTGPGMSTLPSSLYNYIQQSCDPTVSAVSVFLMLCTIVIMVIVDHELGLNKFIKRGQK